MIFTWRSYSSEEPIFNNDVLILKVSRYRVGKLSRLFQCKVTSQIFLSPILNGIKKHLHKGDLAEIQNHRTN